MTLSRILICGLLCYFLVASQPAQGSTEAARKGQLRGINRSGTEYTCVQNNGIFEGPVDDNAIQNMKKWNINIVRVPLNEDCWLGINGHNPNYSGPKYQQAIQDYVKRLRNHNLNVILDLHWTDGIYGGPGQGSCYDYTAKCQKPMPDKQNAPNFWSSVAATFKNDNGVIFDIFNEPFPDMVINDKTQAWKCLRDGGNACPGFQYQVAGMQDLVNAVRSTGAKNLIMSPGLTWTNDLSRWVEFLPKDSANNIAASWHSYDFNACNNQNCWNSQIAPITAKYPVIVGEIGQHGCSHWYIDQLMPWLDQNKVNYLGWTWNTWDCSSGPSLISNYDGTPTEFGKGLFNHLSKAKTTNQSPSNNPSTNNQSNKPSSNNQPTNQPSNSNPSSNVPSTSSSSSGSTANPLAKKLQGVNRSGFEYTCVQNNGISEGPIDDNAIKTMKSWNINVVRVPLNQDCWLGNHGHNANYIGDKYQKAVEDYVKRLRNNDIKVIVDLHWTNGIYGGPGQGTCYDVAAKCQKPMPDKENAPKFWKSVAAKFKGDTGIIFDIFNEPFPDMVINDKTQAWKCLRNGGSACPGFQFQVAGMQDLVNAVRSTGAKNLIMSPGITWTNDLSRWLEFKPNDPANNLAAAWHSYDFNACNNQGCWDSQIAPVAAKFPVIVGEIGEHGCSHGYVDRLMPWLDTKNINYVAWTWNTWDCSSGPALISDYNGNPTNFGLGIRNHFKKTQITYQSSQSSSNKPSTSNQSNQPSSNNQSTNKPSNNSPSTNTPSSNSPSPSSGSTANPLAKKLKGVNRSGFEYTCVQNNGISEGPIDDNAIKSMKSWNINVVRVPLNQDCWLGNHGHNANYIGDKYQKAVEDYVKRLRNNDIKVIVDLHWTNGIYGGPGQGTCYDVSAKCQKPMPDKENAPKFWKSVAAKFKGDTGIIFDIFNEPFPDMVINDKTQAWKCLRDGGSSCPGFQFEVAGMQDLVNAVRSTGAKNLIMSPGITWTNDLSRWIEFKPNDPANNLAAAWHSYDFNACNNQGCWDSQIAPVAAKYPVIVGEIGEHGCSHGYVDKLMHWLDTKNINYVAWTWNTWDCSSGPALISDYNGNPTNFGVGIRDHFKKT